MDGSVARVIDGEENFCIDFCMGLTWVHHSRRRGFNFKRVGQFQLPKTRMNPGKTKTLYRAGGVCGFLEFG